MFIQIEEPSESPQPPDQVRFRGLELEQYADGGRIRLTFEITPFQSGPNLEIEIYDQASQEVAALTVVGAHTNKLSLTAHLRPRDPQGKYLLKAHLAYDELGQVDELERQFSIPDPGAAADG